MPPRDPLAEARKVYADVAEAVRSLRTESTQLNLTLHSAESKLTAMPREIADIQRALYELKMSVQRLDATVKLTRWKIFGWVIIGGFVGAMTADAASRFIALFLQSFVLVWERLGW